MYFNSRIAGQIVTKFDIRRLYKRMAIEIFLKTDFIEVCSHNELNYFSMTLSILQKMFEVKVVW